MSGHTVRGSAGWRHTEPATRVEAHGMNSHAILRRAGRNLLSLGIVALSLILIGGCGKNSAAGSKTQVASKTPSNGFKIGIMTGTVSQGEDEFRAAQMIIKKY